MVERSLSERAASGLARRSVNSIALASRQAWPTRKIREDYTCMVGGAEIPAIVGSPKSPSYRMVWFVR